MDPPDRRPTPPPASSPSASIPRPPPVVTTSGTGSPLDVSRFSASPLCPLAPSPTAGTNNSSHTNNNNSRSRVGSVGGGSRGLDAALATISMPRQSLAALGIAPTQPPGTRSSLADTSLNGRHLSSPLQPLAPPPAPFAPGTGSIAAVEPWLSFSFSSSAPLEVPSTATTSTLQQGCAPPANSPAAVVAKRPLSLTADGTPPTSLPHTANQPSTPHPPTCSTATTDTPVTNDSDISHNNRGSDKPSLSSPQQPDSLFATAAHARSQSRVVIDDTTTGVATSSPIGLSLHSGHVLSQQQQQQDMGGSATGGGLLRTSATLLHSTSASLMKKRGPAGTGSGAGSPYLQGDSTTAIPLGQEFANEISFSDCFWPAADGWNSPKHRARGDGHSVISPSAGAMPMGGLTAPTMTHKSSIAVPHRQQQQQQQQEETQKPSDSSDSRRESRRQSQRHDLANRSFLGAALPAQPTLDALRKRASVSAACANSYGGGGGGESVPSPGLSTVDTSSFENTASQNNYCTAKHRTFADGTVTEIFQLLAAVRKEVEAYALDRAMQEGLHDIFTSLDANTAAIGEDDGQDEEEEEDEEMDYSEEEEEGEVVGDSGAGRLHGRRANSGSNSATNIINIIATHSRKGQALGETRQWNTSSIDVPHLVISPSKLNAGDLPMSVGTVPSSVNASTTALQAHSPLGTRRNISVGATITTAHGNSNNNGTSVLSSAQRSKRSSDDSVQLISDVLAEHPQRRRRESTASSLTGVDAPFLGATMVGGGEGLALQLQQLHRDSSMSLSIGTASVTSPHVSQGLGSACVSSISGRRRGRGRRRNGDAQSSKTRYPLHSRNNNLLFTETWFGVPGTVNPSASMTGSSPVSAGLPVPAACFRGEGGGVLTGGENKSNNNDDDDDTSDSDAENNDATPPPIAGAFSRSETVNGSTVSEKSCHTSNDGTHQQQDQRRLSTPFLSAEPLLYFHESITAEPPLFLSGMVIDPVSGQFFLGGMAFYEEARVLRVPAAPAELSKMSDHSTSSRLVRHASSLMNKTVNGTPFTHKLLLREYISVSKKNEGFMIQTFSILMPDAGARVMPSKHQTISPELAYELVTETLPGCMTRAFSLATIARRTKPTAAVVTYNYHQRNNNSTLPPAAAVGSGGGGGSSGSAREGAVLTPAALAATATTTLPSKQSSRRHPSLDTCTSSFASLASQVQADTEERKSVVGALGFLSARSSRMVSSLNTTARATPSSSTPAPGVASVIPSPPSASGGSSGRASVFSQQHAQHEMGGGSGGGGSGNLSRLGGREGDSGFRRLISFANHTAMSDDFRRARLRSSAAVNTDADASFDHLRRVSATGLMIVSSASSGTTATPLLPGEQIRSGGGSTMRSQMLRSFRSIGTFADLKKASRRGQQLGGTSSYPHAHAVSNSSTNLLTAVTGSEAELGGGSFPGAVAQSSARKPRREPIGHEIVLSDTNPQLYEWALSKDPARLHDPTNNIHAFLTYFSGGFAIKQMVRELLRAVRCLQRFARRCLAKKHRAMEAMLRRWRSLEVDSRLRLHHYHPPPSSVERIELIATNVLQQYMLTTREYKTKLIQELWDERRAGYHAHREHHHMDAFVRQCRAENRPATAEAWRAEKLRTDPRHAPERRQLSSGNGLHHHEHHRHNSNDRDSTSSSSLPSAILAQRVRGRLLRSTARAAFVLPMGSGANHTHNHSQSVSARGTSTAAVPTGESASARRHTSANRSGVGFATGGTHSSRENRAGPRTFVVDIPGAASSTSSATPFTAIRNCSSMYSLISHDGAGGATRLTSGGGSARSAGSSGGEMSEFIDASVLNTSGGARSENNRTAVFNAAEVAQQSREESEAHERFGWFIPPEQLLFESHQRLLTSLKSSVLTIEQVQYEVKRAAREAEDEAAAAGVAVRIHNASHRGGADHKPFFARKNPPSQQRSQQQQQQQCGQNDQHNNGFMGMMAVLVDTDSGNAGTWGGSMSNTSYPNSSQGGGGGGGGLGYNDDDSASTTTSDSRRGGDRPSRDCGSNPFGRRLGGKNVYSAAGLCSLTTTPTPTSTDCSSGSAAAAAERSPGISTGTLWSSKAGHMLSPHTMDFVPCSAVPLLPEIHPTRSPRQRSQPPKAQQRLQGRSGSGTSGNNLSLPTSNRLRKC